MSFLDKILNFYIKGLQKGNKGEITMTKQQAIKKYNLKLKEIKDDFDARYKIETWDGTNETADKKTIYTLTDEFSKVMGDPTPTFFLVVETIYKNKYIRIAKTDSYRHKTICRTYEIKGE